VVDVMMLNARHAPISGTLPPLHFAAGEYLSQHLAAVYRYQSHQISERLPNIVGWVAAVSRR
jgi:hypothetical protein